MENDLILILMLAPFLIGAQWGWVKWYLNKAVAVLFLCLFIIITILTYLKYKSSATTDEVYYYYVIFWVIIGYISGYKAGKFYREYGKLIYFTSFVITVIAISIYSILIEVIVFVIYGISPSYKIYVITIMGSALIILPLSLKYPISLLRVSLSKSFLFLIGVFVTIETFLKIKYVGSLTYYTWSLWKPLSTPHEAYPLFFNLAISLLLAFPDREIANNFLLEAILKSKQEETGGDQIESNNKN